MFVIVSTADLVAAQIEYPGSASPMTLDEKLMMRPPERSRLAAARRVLNVPLRFTASRRSNKASSVSASGVNPGCMMPALLTRTSTLPNAVSVRSNRAATSAGCETSA